MATNWQTKSMEELFKVLVKVKTSKEMAAFMRDLCTIAELKEMAERWQMVLMLEKGVSYREIASTLKTSTATVTRVAHWMKNGEGGYGKMVKRLNGGGD